MCAAMGPATLVRNQLCAYLVSPAPQPTFIPWRRRWQPILRSLDLLSTPEQNCIGLPEQKYISDAGKKGPRTGGLFLRHHAWFGLSAGMSELARRELRLL